jgi:hypothetical protein
MATGATGPCIRREPAILREVVMASEGAGGGWRFQEVTRQLPDRELRNLDVATLRRLLKEAERVMLCGSELLKRSKGWAGTARASSRARTVKGPKRSARTANST